QPPALAGGPELRHASGAPLAARVVARAPVDIAAVGCDVGIVGGVEILVQMRRELEAVSIAQAPVPLRPDEQRVDGARASPVLAVRLVLRAEARGGAPGPVVVALPFPEQRRPVAGVAERL